MLHPNPDEIQLLELALKDRRFRLGAYEFVREAVSYASHVVFATGTHVSGQELLEAIRQFARERYGALAREVFAEWGVTTTEDVGEIVFRLVDAGILSKTEDDDLNDFRGGYDLDQAFEVDAYWTERLGERATPRPAPSPDPTHS